MKSLAEARSILQKYGPSVSRIESPIQAKARLLTSADNHDCTLEGSEVADPGLDRRRFGELVREHQSRIRAYVSSLGVARSSIEDIVQDAFMFAYRNFSSYEEGTSFPAWVGTIARNLAWNDARKTNRRYRILNEAVMETFVEQDASRIVADLEDDTRRRAALEECMRQLPGKNHSMMVDRYYHDLQISHMASQANMEPGTMRKHLLRIRRTLRKCVSAKLNEGREDENI